MGEGGGVYEVAMMEVGKIESIKLAAEVSEQTAEDAVEKKEPCASSD